MHQQDAKTQIQLYARVDTYWLWESRSQLNNVRVMFAWFISTSLSPNDVDQQDAHGTILHRIFTWVCLMIGCMGCLQTHCLLDLPLWWIYYRPPKEHLENKNSTVLMVKLSNPYFQGPRLSVSNMFSLYPHFYSIYLLKFAIYYVHIWKRILKKCCQDLPSLQAISLNSPGFLVLMFAKHPGLQRRQAAPATPRGRRRSCCAAVHR